MRTLKDKPAPPALSTRLIFSYEGETIKLLSSRTLEMVSPPSDSPESDKGEVGFWLEVRDRENSIRYRRVIPNPVRNYAEVRTGDPDRPLAWQKVSSPRGEFVVVVPKIEGAHELLFVNSQPEKRKGAKPSRSVIRFKL